MGVETLPMSISVAVIERKLEDGTEQRTLVLQDGLLPEPVVRAMRVLLRHV